MKICFRGRDLVPLCGGTKEAADPSMILTWRGATDADAAPRIGE